MGHRHSLVTRKSVPLQRKRRKAEQWAELAPALVSLSLGPSGGASWFPHSDHIVQSFPPLLKPSVAPQVMPKSLAMANAPASNPGRPLSSVNGRHVFNTLCTRQAGRQAGSKCSGYKCRLSP